MMTDRHTDVRPKTKSVERTAALLLRSTLGGASRVPRALHCFCRRGSLTSVVRRLASVAIQTGSPGGER
jgi:hypothetical protein